MKIRYLTFNSSHKLANAKTETRILNELYFWWSVHHDNWSRVRHIDCESHWTWLTAQNHYHYHDCQQLNLPEIWCWNLPSLEFVNFSGSFFGLKGKYIYFLNRLINWHIELLQKELDTNLKKKLILNKNF